MAELPRGKVREVRRGGAGVLELLLVDFERGGDDGYLKVEGGGRRGEVGQLVITQGTPSLAIFEGEALLMGAPALRHFRSVAAGDDSRISVHTDVDLDLISELHPEAKLHIDDGDAVVGERIEGWIVDTKSDSDWWRKKQRRVWTPSETSLPKGSEEETAVVEGSINYTPGEELEAGLSYLVDEQTADSVLRVAAHLAAIGHPLLVISREPPMNLATRYAIPAGCCCWLSARDVEDVSTVHPGLESVRRVCDQFLWSSSRAVIVIDGVEYLSGIHGFNSMLGMLRDLIDEVATSDHIVLIPADMDVWNERERTLISREFDVLAQRNISEWAERPAIIEGHSFCQNAPLAEVPPPLAEKSDAADDFRAAAKRILDESSGGDVRGTADAVKSSVGGLDSAPRETEVAPPPLDVVASVAGFHQPETSFSARNLLDEMRRELGPPSTVVEAIGVGEGESESDGQNTPVPDDDSDNFELPSWATAPSANMAIDENLMTREQSTSMPSSPANPETVPEVGQQSIPTAPHQAESTYGEPDRLGGPILESPKPDEGGATTGRDKPLLRQPSVDHHQRKRRRITRGRIPDVLQFERQSTHFAAKNSRVVEKELLTPGWEAVDPRLSALSAKGDDFTEVGEWETTEERDWEVLETGEMGAAVDNARTLRAQPKNSEAATSARLSHGQWNAAIHSATTGSQEGGAEQVTLIKQHARESASRSQRVNLTETLAAEEMAALYEDRERMVKDSKIGLEILERISELADRGHPIRGLVERIEADREEGLQLLSELEEKSIIVNGLIDRLNIQQDRGVIAASVADRYRNSMIDFEQIEEISALLDDYEG